MSFVGFAYDKLPQEGASTHLVHDTGRKRIDSSYDSSGGFLHMNAKRI